MPEMRPRPVGGLYIHPNLPVPVATSAAPAAPPAVSPRRVTARDLPTDAPASDALLEAAAALDEAALKLDKCGSYRAAAAARTASLRACRAALAAAEEESA